MHSAPAAPNGSKSFVRGTVHRLTGWRRLVFWPLAWMLRGYYSTVRFRLSPAVAARWAQITGPILIIAWHNRSLIVPELARRYHTAGRISVLISPSRNGAWEAAFYEFCGLRPVRGSSTRGSIAATRELLAEFAAGQDLGLSPDGPAGPLYCFRRGAVAVARIADAPVLLLSANSRWAWRPRTWDRHFVPLPFAAVDIRVEFLPRYSAMGFADDETAAAHWREKLLAITEDPFTVPQSKETASPTPAGPSLSTTHPGTS